MPSPARRQVFGRGSYTDARFVAEILRAETVGGLLLLAATVVALVWVNTPAGDVYVAVRDFELGPRSVAAHLSVAEWTADGLLAIFFFVAGVELKREFVAGELRDPRQRSSTSSGTSTPEVTRCAGGPSPPPPTSPSRSPSSR